MNRNAAKNRTYQDITVAEARKLLPAATRVHQFYEKLRAGLQRQGVLSTDPYYVRVLEAQNHTHTVMIWTFYATVKQGVGLPERKQE